jgi:hypothetical protein
MGFVFPKYKGATTPPSKPHTKGRGRRGNLGLPTVKFEGIFLVPVSYNICNFRIASFFPCFSHTVPSSM